MSTITLTNGSNVKTFRTYRTKTAKTQLMQRIYNVQNRYMCHSQPSTQRNTGSSSEKNQTQTCGAAPGTIPSRLPR